MRTDGQKSGGAVKISIIMGVWNPDPSGLSRCIDSLIGQKFQSWELLLYDDGSSREIRGNIRRIAEYDSRIICLGSDTNHGLAAALNACIQTARAPYIARMDGDDIAFPERLEEQYTFLTTHSQYQWVGSTAQLIDDCGVWGILSVPERPQAEDFLINSPFIHPSVLFRREALTQTGGYCTDKSVAQLEDYELFMRLYGLGMCGYNIQHPLIGYHEDLAAHRKRTYSRRIREMWLRRRGFKKMGILRPSALPYVLKPLFVGLIPADIHHALRRKMKGGQGKSDG